MKSAIANLSIPASVVMGGRAAALLCIAAILALSSGGCFDGTLTRREGSGSHATLNKDCGECHVADWEEWKGSPHADAFTSAAFTKLTNGYQFKPCLSCHAPKTIFADELEARKLKLEEGVNCVSCHLLDKKIQSAKVFSSYCPHPVGERSDYSKAELCGKCHKRAFSEWRSWKSSGESAEKSSQGNDKPTPKKTCQECHMPIVERKPIQGMPWELLHFKKRLRRHTFTAFDEDLLENAVRMSVTDFAMPESNGRVVIKGTIVIEVNEVGHAIPTGDYGYREAALTIVMKDKFGIARDKKIESFFVEDGTALRPGESKRIPFDFQDVSTDVTAIGVRLLRVPFSGVEGAGKVMFSMTMYLKPAFE